MVLVRRTRAVLALVAFVAALGLVACGDDDEDAPELGNDVNAEGERLVQAWVGAAASGDRSRIEQVISPGLLLVRANGGVYDHDSYLENIATINSFTISNVRAVQRGNVLSVAYTLVTDQVVDGRQQPTDPAPRLTTFLWEDGRWLVVSHANFGAILPGIR
jgi:hypothetical protein